MEAIDRLLWVGIEVLVTVPFTALIGGLVALCFYRYKIERKDKINVIRKFRLDPGKSLSDAVIAFNKSKAVISALLKLHEATAARDGKADIYLKEAVEAMYDDIGIKYDNFPVLCIFSTKKEVELGEIKSWPGQDDATARVVDSKDRVFEFHGDFDNSLAFLILKEPFVLDQTVDGTIKISLKGTE